MWGEGLDAKGLQIGVRHGDARADEGVVLDESHIGREAAAFRRLGDVLEKEGVNDLPSMPWRWHR